MTPAQLLRLIAGASMVLTDSFHAAAFSLLLHTPCTILRRYREDDPESRNSRVDQLLRTLQVADPTHPDFAVVDEQLAIQRKRGLDFLQSAISQAVSQATPAKAR